MTINYDLWWWLLLYTIVIVLVIMVNTIVVIIIIITIIIIMIKIIIIIIIIIIIGHTEKNSSRGCKIQSCETFCSCGVTRNVCSFFVGERNASFFLVHFDLFSAEPTTFNLESLKSIRLEY